jgi:hypothetical protein
MMLGTSEAPSGNSAEPRGPFRLAGLALATVGLVALAPASAHGATTVVHSAESGKLAGGGLTLYGVGRKVTVTTNAGRSPVVRVKTMHRRLFSPRTPATGTLHVDGHHGGDEPTFRLSRPRYNAARRTVAYRAKPLNNKPLPRAAATVRRFGAASLTIAPHAAVMGGDYGGNDCYNQFINETGYGMQFQSANKQPGDTWDEDSPPVQGLVISDTTNDQGHLDGLDSWGWESDGALWSGCANDTVWALIVDPDDPQGHVPPPNVTIGFFLSWPWTYGPSFGCRIQNNPGFTCTQDSSGTFHVNNPNRP